MTLEEIKASAKEMLSPADIAPILGCNPYSINVMVKTDKPEGSLISVLITDYKDDQLYGTETEG